VLLSGGAGVLAFTGIILGAVVIAKILFFVFLVMLMISLIAFFLR
jgi:uncharacterized membrane protein YtjA (UPF0391 family)